MRLCALYNTYHNNKIMRIYTFRRVCTMYLPVFGYIYAHAVIDFY